MAARKHFVCGVMKKDDEVKDPVVDDIVRFFNDSPLDKNADLVVALPEAYLRTVSSQLTKPNVKMALDLRCKGLPSHFSAQKVKDSEVQWVILGQGEKSRAEGDCCKELGNHIREAQGAGVGVMVFVGETLKERETVQTEEVITRQMEGIAENVEDWYRVIIVYRPWWTVGTCKTITTLEVRDVHRMIRHWLARNLGPPLDPVKIRVIYGGSVSGNHSPELSTKEEIDGFLVDGCSFSCDFLKIINARK